MGLVLDAIADKINTVNFNDPIIILCENDLNRIIVELRLSQDDSLLFRERILSNNERIFDIEVFFNKFSKISYIVERDKPLKFDKRKIYNEPIRL